MPNPLWTPPTGDDPKLGQLDRIACGEQSADRGTRLDAHWRPFVPGTRHAAPDDHRLGVARSWLYPSLSDIGDDWQLVSSSWMALQRGEFSPCGRRIVDEQNVLWSVGAPGTRHVTLPPTIRVRDGAGIETDNLRLRMCTFAPDSNSVVGWGVQLGAACHARARL
ncbi:MAG: hypothetical protein AB7K09_18290 [Planctomycetota bacterium]